MARILLIEDNDLNRDLLSRRLRKKGYDVLAAADGQQGLSLAVEEIPDLILMDMSLPVMDGWQVTRLLKAKEQTKKIPVIGLSAHAMAGDKEKALKAGCDDYETKPLDFDKLLIKINSFL